MKKSISIITLIIVIVVFCVYKDISLFWGFFACNIILLILDKDKKKSIRTGILELAKVRNLYFIVLLLGATISIWMSSGVIPTIVYYGISYIDKVNFLVVTFLTTAVLSSVMGTGLGTLSTIGLAFYGLGLCLGLPAQVILGTIVSGAFISDKISPVSALTNLTIEIVDIDYKKYFKTAIRTLGPTVVVTGIIYFVMNGFIGKGEAIAVYDYQLAIFQNYKISMFLLFLPVLMIILSMSGVNVLVSMMVVLVSGSVLTLVYQRVQLGVLLDYLIFGHTSATGNDFIDGIFHAGGIFPMIEVILIITGAVFLTSLLMSSKVLDPIFNRLFSETKSNFSLILKTAFISVFLTSMTCDQTVGIVVPGELLKDHYKKRGLSMELLARTISDTGTIIAPLQFWNVNALIITGITGVSALEYAPYAVLCYLSPVMTLFIAKLNDRHGLKV